MTDYYADLVKREEERQQDMAEGFAGSSQRWREWWSGEPSLRRHPLRWAVWLLDEALDRVPMREDGRWFRKSGLGCRLGLHRFWYVPEPTNDASGLSS